MTRAAQRRHNAKRDGNEKEIIAAFESEGCIVQRLNEPGVCDLLVCAPAPFHRTFLAEVKMPGETLNEKQELFHKKWPGEKHIVRMVSEVPSIVKL